jgi:glycerol uptake facilitator-like aquaporin
VSSTPDHRSLRVRRFAAEAIGTFFLVLIGPGSAMANAMAVGRSGMLVSHWPSRSS